MADLSHVPAVGGIVLNTRDVTEQAALEMQIHQTQKLEAVGLLAGGIAHDFNNILAVVRASTELLAAADDEPDARAVEVREIKAAVDRGVALARQLSRSGGATPSRWSGSTCGTPSWGCGNAAAADRGRPPGWKSRPDHEVPVLGDRGQMEQVVLNLAINARDATPPGGRVKITVVARDLPAARGAAARAATPC